jgi:FkbM family methyltransferase
LEKGPTFQGRGSYQLKKIKAAMEFVPKKRVALDIGAHVGTWSLALASYFGIVHAFEPVFREFLRENTEHCPNISIYEFALGNEDGVIGMDVATENSGNTRVVPPTKGLPEGWTPGNSYHRPPSSVESCKPIVTVHKLDTIAESRGIEYADFIKIDVEGYEHDVILGAEKFINACKPVMVVEQKPGNSERYGRPRGSAVELLKSWGATEVWSMSGDHCMRWK